jgi:hypothetical protein
MKIRINYFYSESCLHTTTNVSLFFRDDNNDDSVSVMGNIIVKLISIGNTVVGRVMGGSSENYIHVKLEVPYAFEELIYRIKKAANIAAFLYLELY